MLLRSGSSAHRLRRRSVVVEPARAGWTRFRAVRAQLLFGVFGRRVPCSPRTVRTDESPDGWEENRVDRPLGAGVVGPVGQGQVAEAPIAAHDDDSCVRQAGEIARQVAHIG